LRYQASIAENPAVGTVFSQAADELTKSLAVQIDKFQRAPSSAAGASA
jgi:hypothetical protein